MGDAAAWSAVFRKRFAGAMASVDLTTYFKMARGEVGKHDRVHNESVAAALEMTKVVDTKLPLSRSRLTQFVVPLGDT